MLVLVLTIPSFFFLGGGKAYELKYALNLSSFSIKRCLKDALSNINLAAETVIPPSGGKKPSNRAHMLCRIYPVVESVQFLSFHLTLASIVLDIQCE